MAEAGNAESIIREEPKLLHQLLAYREGWGRSKEKTDTPNAKDIKVFKWPKKLVKFHCEDNSKDTIYSLYLQEYKKGYSAASRPATSFVPYYVDPNDMHL